MEEVKQALFEKTKTAGQDLDGQQGRFDCQPGEAALMTVVQGQQVRVAIGPRRVPVNSWGEYSSLTCWQPNALEGTWKK